MAAPRGIEFTGLRELNTYLGKIGVPDDAIKTAMNEAGNIIVDEARRIMPNNTGKMARTLKANKSKGKLQVKVGSKTVPYAYTFHATAMGKSDGGFTFDVPRHTRKGRSVNPYSAKRRIQDRAFLYVAFETKKQAVYQAYVLAIGNLIKGAA